MPDRIEKKEVTKQLAERMNADEASAYQWLETVLETFYDNIKQGTTITLTGFGGFYVQPKRPTWVFKFNPGQKLKAVFGWSSTYKGKI
ncbi:MAG: HU family DNA-binding protein [bacterium]|nr:MAG: HU family DNA-binding protein [bacterium]